MKIACYPCSGFDGSIVKALLPFEFTDFIYIDHDFTAESIRAYLEENTFRGFNTGTCCHSVADWAVKKYFLATYEFSEIDGSQLFRIHFCKGDAIAVMKSLLRKFISIQCIAYIRPGISFGGNRSSYPNEFFDLIKDLETIEYLVHDWDVDVDIHLIKEIFPNQVGQIIATTEVEQHALITIRRRW